MAGARLGFRMQHVPAFAIQAVAAQLVEAGDAPDVRSHAEILLQQLRGGDRFAQDRAAAEQLHLRRVLAELALPSLNRYMPLMMPASAPFGMAGCA